jgi:hypothetical protein
MGYPLDIDDMDDEALAKELEERRDMRARGVCAYCKRPLAMDGQHLCKHAERERAAIQRLRAEAIPDNGPHRIEILPNGEGHFGFLQHMRTRDAKVTHIAALPGGMTSGKASVMIVSRLPDRSYVLQQMSLRLLLQANAVFLGTYGVEADGKSAANHNEATKERINAATLISALRALPGGELTIDVAELNAIMQTPHMNVEVQYHDDNRRMTIRVGGSD